MDIKRQPPKQTRKYLMYGGGLVALVVVTLAVSKLKPAAPVVERGTLWIDTVKRGPMTRDVSAPGTLEPEYVRNVTAMTSGRVESLPVRPGATVTTRTVLVAMSNPDEEIKQLQNEQLLKQSAANLVSLKTSLRQQVLSQRGVVATTETQYNQAVRDAAVQDSLATKQLASLNDIAAARDRVREMRQRLELERQRLADMQTSEQQQVALQEQTINSLQRILSEQQKRVASMTVTSPEDGQLQSLGNPMLELGQYVNAGTVIARVVRPGRLKAVLRVPENQAREVVPNLPATIDLHNNVVVKGHVIRTDPSSVQGTVTVEVAIDDSLPAGTRSDLAVDGTIQLEHVGSTVFVGRPGFGQPESPASLYKIVPNSGEAVRTVVRFGRAAVNAIEVRSGLQPGDSVVISDLAQLGDAPRIRIK